MGGMWSGEPKAAARRRNHGQHGTERLAGRNLERRHIEHGIEPRTRGVGRAGCLILHGGVHGRVLESHFSPASCLESRARIFSCSAVYSGANVSELNASLSTWRASSEPRSAAS